MGMTVNELVGALEFVEAEEPEDIDLERLNDMLTQLYTKQQEGKGDWDMFKAVTMDGLFQPGMVGR